MSHNEVYSKGNIPFSWELKPGVSKVTHGEGSIDVRHVTPNLHPPHLVKEVHARFCVADLQGIISPGQLQLRPRSTEKKGNVYKQEDPFAAAYMKCTEYSVNGKLGTDHKTNACRTWTKMNMFTLSCKRSCSVSRGHMVRVSQCSKAKKEQQKENKCCKIDWTKRC